MIESKAFLEADYKSRKLCAESVVDEGVHYLVGGGTFHNLGLFLFFAVPGVTAGRLEVSGHRRAAVVAAGVAGPPGVVEVRVGRLVPGAVRVVHEKLALQNDWGVPEACPLGQRVCGAKPS